MTKCCVEAPVYFDLMHHKGYFTLTNYMEMNMDMAQKITSFLVMVILLGGCGTTHEKRSAQDCFNQHVEEVEGDFCYRPQNFLGGAR